MQDRIGGELRGDQDRLVGLQAAAQPPGQFGPREPDLPGFGGVGSGVRRVPAAAAVVVTVPLPYPDLCFTACRARATVGNVIGPVFPLIVGPAPPSPRGCRTDADRRRPSRTPAGVFGAELRFYRTRAGLSQKDLAAKATVSHDVISKIETGERPPAEDFPPRLDAVPELDTRGALTRLWEHLKKGHKQRLYGWFQQWAGIEAQAAVLRWYEPLVVPGLLQTEEYARAILSARPDGNLDDLEEQVAARLARQAILGRTGAPQLWCILDEGVLHRAIGGSKVMRSQLYRLAEVAEHPKTTIQLIRSAAPTPACWRTS